LECIFYEGELQENAIIEAPESEIKHIRALRLSEGDKLNVTNGKGSFADAIISKSDKSGVSICLQNICFGQGETGFRFGLAFGILSKLDYFEYAFQKAIELGITDFYPLTGKYVQKSCINSARLSMKAIAAIKQSKRSTLPVIHFPMNINDVLGEWNNESYVILADESGNSPTKQKLNGKPRLVFVGCEGGFSDDEQKTITNDPRTIVWNLGNRRLRAETAAVLAVGIASLI
jgi:16S rRNA (uracil1498-N3)-methyltransferase